MNTDRFKFRAWDGKEMDYDFMITGFEYSNVLGVLWDEEYAKEKYGVKEWKLMQSTGLFDSSKILIWEGDLISNNYQTDKEVIRQVIFSNGCWIAKRIKGISKFKEDLILADYCQLNFRVTGNVYETNT